MRKIELGQIVATADVAKRMKTERAFNDFVRYSIQEFRNCNWGDMVDSDKEMNDEAVKSGDGRIHGVYSSSALSVKIWIITEADRKTTTILYPHEY